VHGAFHGITSRQLTQVSSNPVVLLNQTACMTVLPEPLGPWTQLVMRTKVPSAVGVVSSQHNKDEPGKVGHPPTIEVDPVKTPQVPACPSCFSQKDKASAASPCHAQRPRRHPDAGAAGAHFQPLRVSRISASAAALD
jgi:hypothetical protein